jgi:hypothetical protein
MLADERLAVQGRFGNYSLECSGIISSMPLIAVISHSSPNHMTLVR